ncbi:oligosaccharide flippase family protein [Candidatus Parcubacteria bacterium]|nr:oligosaccharide flippase family protein [Patescibacteria group bacterium]MBU4381059.1 oligosaccharide flippase family protein [Patescibacteria group bacterium]MCG2689396.1 oligosaccharide flippase family protein [Candidatus Parcubacteria bacterium]
MDIRFFPLSTLKKRVLPESGSTRIYRIYVGPALFFTVNLASSFVSYLFQLLASRALSIVEYGELVALFSAIGIITLPFAVVNPAIVKKVSEYKVHQNFASLTKLFSGLVVINLLFSLILLLFFGLFSKQSASWLNIANQHTILLCSLIAGVSLVSGLPGIFLQGLLRFKGASFLGIIASVAKLFFGIGGIILLSGVIGAFYGLLFGFILVFIVGCLVLKKNLHLKNIFELDFAPVRSIFSYAVSSVIIIAPITIILNLDTILAKHYLVPELAGIYSSVAIIGKIIFFGVSGFGAIVFPIISEKVTRGESLDKFIAGSLKIYLALLFCAVAIYRFFPQIIVNLLFGSRYIDAIPHLGIYAVYISFYSILSLFSTIYLATARFAYGKILLGGLFLYLGFVVLSTKTINGLIYAGILSMGLTLVATIVYHYAFVRNSSRLQAGKDN